MTATQSPTHLKALPWNRTRLLSALRQPNTPILLGSQWSKRGLESRQDKGRKLSLPRPDQSKWDICGVSHFLRDVWDGREPYPVCKWLIRHVFALHHSKIKLSWQHWPNYPWRCETHFLNCRHGAALHIHNPLMYYTVSWNLHIIMNSVKHYSSALLITCLVPESDLKSIPVLVTALQLVSHLWSLNMTEPKTKILCH